MISPSLPSLLDPDRLNGYPPAEILEAAARGHLGLDRRFLHAILDRKEEGLPAALAYAERDRSADPIDLTPELIAILRHWRTPESLPFFLAYIEADPSDVPDELLEAVVEIGAPALEPLLDLYEGLDEEEGGEVAFILAHLRIKDDRILQLLLNRIEYNLSDTVLLLGVYGDERARGSLEAAAVDLTEVDAELKREIEDALAQLGKPPATEEEFTFDIWCLYPPEADIPMDALDADERLQLLEAGQSAALRAAAAASFFNEELTDGQKRVLLRAATNDESNEVRARAWEGLMHATDDPNVVEAMLAAVRNPATTDGERAGLVVGLAPEADRNEVRDAILALYRSEAHRAKAMEAMWRSMYEGFRDHFVPHLRDSDLEIRRSAIWGIGYYGIRSELDHLRKLFEDNELRSDALFAYALALPGETSRSRVQGFLSKIESDAHGLTELEEDLVKAALDERLMLAGHEPVFAAQQD